MKNYFQMIAALALSTSVIFGNPEYEAAVNTQFKEYKVHKANVCPETDGFVRLQWKKNHEIVMCQMPIEIYTLLKDKEMLPWAAFLAFAELKTRETFELLRHDWKKADGCVEEAYKTLLITYAYSYYQYYTRIVTIR